MIMLLVTAAWPCYVLDACPSSISLQYVLALCPLGCSDFYFLKISMAVHPLEVRLGPHELKKMLKKMKFPQASLAEISVVFLYQSVYRSTSALNISEQDGPILTKFQQYIYLQCILHRSPKAQ
jgi:hypothetical protein